ncbi:hypothetical protein ABVT42_15670 [Aliikangiella sp. GXAS 306]
MIISPAYLKSKYCLWELVNSLVYGPNTLVIVFNGIQGFSQLTDDKLFLDYCNFVNTLIEALCQVYEEKNTKMHELFKIKPEKEIDEQNIKEYFAQCLSELSGRVYEKENKKELEPQRFNISKGDNVNKPSESGNAIRISDLGGELLRYFSEIKQDHIIKGYWAFLEKEFGQ